MKFKIKCFKCNDVSLINIPDEQINERQAKLEDAIKEHIKVMIKPTTNRYTITKRCKEILKLIEGE